MRISLAITVNDEYDEYIRQLAFLEKFIFDTAPRGRNTTRYTVHYIIDDRYKSSEGGSKIWEHLQEHSLKDYGVKQVPVSLNNDFATYKNTLSEQCRDYLPEDPGYIFQLDADEMISEEFLFNLPAMLEANPEVEAYWLPRVNIVDGLTLPFVQKWRWVLTTLPEFIPSKSRSLITDGEYELLKSYDYIVNEENGYITYKQPIVVWPDFQQRIYKNDPKIRWEGKVHERLVGFEHYSYFPQEVQYAILHHKNLAKQISQNSFYETIAR